MATISVAITSTMGYVKSTGTIVGAGVLIGNILDFQNNAVLLGEPQTKVLVIESQSTGYPIGTFNCYPNQYSDSQKILFKNSGTTSMVITSVLFSADGAVPRIEYGPGWGSISTTIEPGAEKYFNLSYKGNETFGDYFNYILVGSDNDEGNIRVNTLQNVSYGFDWVIDPANLVDTIVEIGESIEQTFLITPTQRNIDYGSIITSLGATSTHTGGWKLIDSSIINEIGHVKVRFDPDIVNNVNTSYEQTVVITVNGVTKNIVNTATVLINTSTYRHLIDWLGPASSHNSVIGISYDRKNSEKVLTIGVGLGGDGTPIYDQGGASLLDIDMLGIGADTLDYPYAHWAEVYEFRNLGSGTNRTMISGLRNADGDPVYQVKTTGGINYSYYFGNGNSKGSMFTIFDDGQGNLNINLNGLRELSGDNEFDDTLKNLTRAFHYYSEADTGTRYTNLPQYPIDTPPSTGTVKAPYNETRTRIFRGFTGIGNTWTTSTSLVSIPS